MNSNKPSQDKPEKKPAKPDSLDFLPRIKRPRGFVGWLQRWGLWPWP